MPSIHHKSTWALAAAVAPFVIAYRVAQGDVLGSRATALATLGLVLALCVAAIVLAVLDLREVRAERQRAATPARARRSYWPSIVALLLAISFLGTFGFYAASRYLGA